MLQRTRWSLALVAGVLVAGAPSSATAQDIDGQYIVVMKDGTSGAGADRVARLVRDRGGDIGQRYSHVLDGFSAHLGERALAALRDDPAVDFVEPDRVVQASDIQQNAPWGLDRIDQRARPLSTSYNFASSGQGVTAYVIDTGIHTAHSEFGGRAVDGTDAVDHALPADDCNGHGTHVAGTIGGATYGVAKAVRLVAVRVLDCKGSGSTSSVIAGIDWVTADHAAGQPAVANMSLGGTASPALDDAVKRSIADGVVYSVAAGNDDADACGGSPARVPEAITVGSTTSSDERSSFSDFGPCVDLFAPGTDITSAWYTSNTATNTISGTSMAAPHVAGAAARVLQSTPGATPAAVTESLTGAATTGVITNLGQRSPDRLLYAQPG